MLQRILIILVIFFFKVYPNRVRYFYLDCVIGNSFVCPLNPEVRQSLFRVVDFLEDNYCLRVRPASFSKMRGAMSMFMDAMEKDGFGPSLCSSLQNGAGMHLCAFFKGM